MDPGSGVGGIKGAYALCEQPNGDAGENIPCPGGREIWRRVSGDRGVTIWPRNDRVPTFQQNHRSASGRCGPRALQSAARDTGKEPRKLPVMGCQDAILVQRIEQDRWRISENAERIGIENARLPEAEEPEGMAPGQVGDTTAGANQDRISTTIPRIREKILSAAHDLGHDRDQIRRISGQCHRRASDGHNSCTAPERSRGGTHL